MTKTILDKIRYIDDVTDEVIDSIEEVRSSVSYTLNSTTKNLTLNGSSDYEIKNINGEEYIVYGYPVCRLGFNPTSRNWDIESKLAKVA